MRNLNTAGLPKKAPPSMAVNPIFLRPTKLTGALKIKFDWLMKGMALKLTSYKANLEKEAILGTLVIVYSFDRTNFCNELDDEELATETKMLLTSASVNPLLLPLCPLIP